MIARRGFLATAMAAALSGASRNRIGLDRISAITDEIARSSQAAIDFARQYGLRWVELRNVPGQRKEYIYLDEAEVRAEAQLLRQNKIGVSFLNSSLLKLAIPGLEPVRWQNDLKTGRTTPEQLQSRLERDKLRFESRLDDLRKALRAAAILEVNKLRVFTGWRAADPAAAAPRVAEILNEMAEIAEKAKVHLLIENEAGCNVGTCAELASLLKLVPSKYAGLNWDPLNAFHLKESPFPGGYELLPVRRIGNVQIKGKSILPGSEQLNWRAIFNRLEADGYRGQVGLETHIFGEIQIQASHDSMKEILKLVAS